MFVTPKKIHEGGQGLVEYALIILLVSVVVVAGLTLFGTAVSSMFARVVPSL